MSNNGPLYLSAAIVPLNDIVDVGVVAPRGSITKLVDRDSSVNAAGELMNGQVGPLPRSVNRKVAKCDDPHFGQMRESRTKKLARDFCAA